MIKVSNKFKSRNTMNILKATWNKLIRKENMKNFAKRRQVDKIKLAINLYIYTNTYT